MSTGNSHCIIKSFLYLCLLIGGQSCHGGKEPLPPISAVKTRSPLPTRSPDSTGYQQIKNQFYRSPDGWLVQRTFAQVEVPNIDTLVDVEHFDSSIPQDIDPLTFEELTGWYARDKNFVYYYRPTSGGMLLSKMAGADVHTFKVMDKEYRLAMDSRHVFEGSSVLDGLNPSDLAILRNCKGCVIQLSTGGKVYKFDPVE